jgi:hypothetical protein
VSELSGLPGLLGRIDDPRAFALLEEGDATDPETAGSVTAEHGPDTAEPQPSTVDLVTRIRAVERGRRIRRRLAGVGALAAAAALASILTFTIPAALAPQAQQPDMVSFFSSANEQPIPIDVIVNLTSKQWGTKLTMDCIYHPAPDASAAYGPMEYSLWVVGTDGTERSVSTWKSSPGSEIVLDTATGTAIADIAHLDLRNADGTQVLMSGNVSATD